MKKILLVVILFAACKKDQSHEATTADKQKAIDVRGFLSGKNVSLQAYYASKPIKYQGSDTLATNLWGYVPWAILDDSTVLDPSGNLNIYQQARVYSFMPDPLIIRPWSVEADDRGVHVEYVSYRYDPLEYDYISNTDTTFTMKVYAKDYDADLITVLKVNH